MNHNLNNSLFAISFSLIIVISLSYCTTVENGDNSNENGADTIMLDAKAREGLNKAKHVLYSLPSPMEIAKLIKSSGAGYNADILNPTGNVNNYLTNKIMALNLGIYGADLSYISMFDQTQASIDYMTASRKLANGLGILDAIDENTIESLKDNVNDRDAIINIISETFMNSDSYLKENRRDEIAALIVVGGWIEGLYLAIQLTEKTLDKNKELIDRVIDQKLSLLLMINLLELYKDEENVKGVLNDMNQVKALYDNLSKFEEGQKPENDMNVNPDTYKKMCDKVEQIRNSYTK